MYLPRITFYRTMLWGNLIVKMKIRATPIYPQETRTEAGRGKESPKRGKECWTTLSISNRGFPSGIGNKMAVHFRCQESGVRIIDSCSIRRNKWGRFQEPNEKNLSLRGNQSWRYNDLSRSLYRECKACYEAARKGPDGDRSSHYAPFPGISAWGGRLEGAPGRC